MKRGGFEKIEKIREQKLSKKDQGTGLTGADKENSFRNEDISIGEGSKIRDETKGKGKLHGNIEKQEKKENNKKSVDELGKFK